MLVYGKWLPKLGKEWDKSKSTNSVVFTTFDEIDSVFQLPKDNMVMVTTSSSSSASKRGYSDVGITMSVDNRPVQIGPKFLINGKQMNVVNGKRLLLGQNDNPVKTISSVPENINKWYSTNVCVNHPKIECLPLGVHPAAEKFIPQYLDGPKTGLLYVNFSCERSDEYNCNSDRPHIFRTNVFEHFKNNCSWATVKERPVKKNVRGGKTVGVSFASGHTKGQEDYVKNLSRHLFALAPQGNGIDTCRMWECLYLGVIPIVQKSALTEAFSDLPILEVESSKWTDIDSAMLTETYEEMSGRKYNTDKLKKSYWVEQICNS